MIKSLEEISIYPDTEERRSEKLPNYHIIALISHISKGKILLKKHT